MTPDDTLAAMNEVVNDCATKGRDYTADVVSDGMSFIKEQRATIARQAAEIAAKDAEIGRLRQIVSDCASAIGNGAFAKPECSLEFMERIPVEIAAVAKLREDEITDPRALTTWRPIAEAPRDGTDILLWVGVGMSDPWAQTGRWVDKLATNAWSGWVDTYEGEDVAEPTHWMPLPPPPSVEET